MVLNSKASSSQQNLQMTLKKVWIVSYLVFITDVQMCGSVFVCKYEMRKCGSRIFWLLHFHFAFLMPIDAKIHLVQFLWDETMLCISCIYRFHCYIFSCILTLIGIGLLVGQQYCNQNYFIA